MITGIGRLRQMMLAADLRRNSAQMSAGGKVIPVCGRPGQLEPISNRHILAGRRAESDCLAWRYQIVAWQNEPMKRARVTEGRLSRRARSTLTRSAGSRRLHSSDKLSSQLPGSTGNCRRTKFRALTG